MTYGCDPAGYHYAFDGMYCDINSIVSQDEEDAREAENQQSQLAKNKLRLKLTKHLSRYSEQERILFQGCRFLLRQHQHNLVKKYLQIEALPSSYADVVIRKDALQILVEGFFSHTLGSNLDFFEQATLECLLVQILENNKKETAYSRVAELRQLILSLTDNKQNCELLSLPIDSENFRQLLSACRLSILLNDYTSKNDIYQLEVCERTRQDFAYEMSKTLDKATLPNGKNYIPRWKARHLHTLDYYANAETGKGLKKLEAIDKSQELKEYINAVVEVCLSVKTD